MDAKNIYIAVQNAVRKAVWVPIGEYEWGYVGEKSEFDKEKAQKEINDYFPETTLYFSVDRHMGHEISKDKAAWNIQKHIESGAFLLSMNLKKVMIFSNVGTFKRGSIAS